MTEIQLLKNDVVGSNIKLSELLRRVKLLLNEIKDKFLHSLHRKKLCEKCYINFNNEK